MCNIQRIVLSWSRPVVREPLIVFKCFVVHESWSLTLAAWSLKLAAWGLRLAAWSLKLDASPVLRLDALRVKV